MRKDPNLIAAPLSQLLQLVFPAIAASSRTADAEEDVAAVGGGGGGEEKRRIRDCYYLNSNSVSRSRSTCTVCTVPLSTSRAPASVP